MSTDVANPDGDRIFPTKDLYSCLLEYFLGTLTKIHKFSTAQGLSGFALHGLYMYF